MKDRRKIHRRTVLRGLGAAVALPLLESMSPSRVLAKSAATHPALRVAFLYIPNGVQMPHWTPKEQGRLGELPRSLGPLKAFREELLMLSGLTQENAEAKGDGPGDHARSAATFLTGCHPLKTAGANLRVGVSIDQLIAQHVGRYTPLPSLELGCEQGMQIGSCDSGYSCAYSNNISWRSPSQPMTKEVHPKLVFERFFGSGDAKEREESRARRDQFEKSILDFVRDDAARLRKRIGAGDRRKVDEYLTAVREVESRIQRTGKAKAEDYPEAKRPDGIPKEYEQHIRLMYDLLALAFQANLTRVATMMIANEGSNRSYAFLGVPEGHHDLSHHGRDEKKTAKIQRIDEFHVTQLAYFLSKLRTIREEGETLLDRSLVLYGSGIGDGNRHNHDDLPILLAGKGCGTIQTGRHLQYPNRTPLNNLFLSMLDRFGVPASSFGDGTGRLPYLDG